MKFTPICVKFFLYYYSVLFWAFARKKKTDSSSINEVVRKIDKMSKTNGRSFIKYKVINNKKIKENWQHFDNKQFSRIIINHVIDSMRYSEKYYFKNGSLIYAYESEILYSPFWGQIEYSIWSGDFYFSKGKLIDHVTLGHGKSELDDWDPENEILQRLKKRKAELHY